MSEPTKVAFGPGGISDVGECRVYTRERWADDWVEEPYLRAEELAWCCAPAMPAATLRWDYGRILRHDGVSWETVPKLDWTFPRPVKLVVECEYDAASTTWSTREWVGVLEMAIDQTDGATLAEVADPDDPQAPPKHVALPTGRQLFTAFGLESLLAKQRPQFTAFTDASGEQSCDGLRMTFNAHGVKNRSPNENATTDAYTFHYDPETAKYWDTLEIVRYLLRYGGPRASGFATAMRFRVRAGAYLPNWDRPEVSLDGQTTLGLLNRLLHRGRLLNWWLEVIADDEGDIVELVTQTILEADLQTDLPGHHIVPESTRQLHLIYDTDQETQAVVKDSGLPVCDQVVIRGGLIQYVGSFSGFFGVDLPAAALQSFGRGWEISDEVKYGQGASTSDDYAGLDLTEQQRRNAMARSSPALENVYSRFVLLPFWNQCVYGSLTSAGPKLFVRYDANAIQPTPFSAMDICPHLPIYYGVDYSDNAVSEIAAETKLEPQGEREYFPPLVLFKRPEHDSYVIAQEMGRSAETETADDLDEPACTVSVHVKPHARSFRLRVSGKPQHVIASTDFTPLDEDEGPGVYDYSLMQITLCLTNGLRIEERYPVDVPPGSDAVRIHEIEAGDQYEAVYVAPRTIVGLTTKGQPARSNGGWIERPAGMRAQLKALAQIAYTWYSQPHWVLQLETARLKGEDVIVLGDLVTRVGDDSDPDNTHQRKIVAPITEIRVSWPTSDGGAPSSPSMSITTSAGELDPIQLQAPPPPIEAKGVERRTPGRAGSAT